MLARSVPHFLLHGLDLQTTATKARLARRDIATYSVFGALPAPSAVPSDLANELPLAP
jgi:hypothetical protein